MVNNKTSTHVEKPSESMIQSPEFLSSMMTEAEMQRLSNATPVDITPNRAITSPSSFTSMVMDESKQQALLSLFKLVQSSPYCEPDTERFRAKLLRFLKAKHFHPENAFEKYVAAEKWRKNELHNYYQFDSRMEAEFLLGKFHFLGLDSCGRPIVVVHTWKHDPYASPSELIIRLMVLTFEYFLTKVMSHPVEQFVLILDQQDASWRNIDMTLERAVLQMFQKYYPDRIFVCLILNSPWFVRVLFNNFIKLFLKPQYFEKVCFLETPSDLINWIPVSVIPMEYGGYVVADYGKMATDLVRSIKDFVESTNNNNAKNQCISSNEKLFLTNSLPANMKPVKRTTTATVNATTTATTAAANTSYNTTAATTNTITDSTLVEEKVVVSASSYFIPPKEGGYTVYSF